MTGYNSVSINRILLASRRPRTTDKKEVTEEISTGHKTNNRQISHYKNINK